MYAQRRFYIPDVTLVRAAGGTWSVGGGERWRPTSSIDICSHWIRSSKTPRLICCCTRLTAKAGRYFSLMLSEGISMPPLAKAGEYFADVRVRSIARKLEDAQEGSISDDWAAMLPDSTGWKATVLHGSFVRSEVIVAYTVMERWHWWAARLWQGA